MTITKYNITNEETGEVLKTYTAVICKRQSEREKALSTFKNYLKELKIEIGNCQKIQSILLFDNLN